MLRATTRTLIAAAAVAAAACATTSFHSTWRNPAAEPLNFKGQKVCALIVSKEEGVRYGAEDALAREITKHGAVGIAAYTLVDKHGIVHYTDEWRPGRERWQRPASTRWGSARQAG